MRMLFSGLVVAAAVALSAPAIAASVMSPAGVAAAANEASEGVVQQVAHGCGRGWWRGPDGVGRCRPMRRGVVVVPPVVGPPVIVVPRARWCHRPFSSRNYRC